MPNDLTDGFLGSTLAAKYYGIAKGNFPHASWVAMPHPTSKDLADQLGRIWVTASKELTMRLTGTGVAIDIAVIKAGRERMTAAIGAMFAPGASLDDAVGEVVNEITNVAGYPDLSAVVRNSGLRGAKQAALADAVRHFESACFSAAMEGVALLENRDQLLTNDTLDETSAKLRLVDTADALYDVVGDPPAGLYIDQGENPVAYLAYACTGIQPSNLGPVHSKETFHALMNKSLDALKRAPDAGDRCAALEGVTEVISQLNQTTRELAATHSMQGVIEAHGAAQLGMVFTEAVRQVTGLPARGAGTPRPAKPDTHTMDERDSLADEVIRELHEEEEKEGHTHDGR